MWTRAELKAKARVAFKANYWKSVFVALLLAILVGTGGAVGGRMGGAASGSGVSVSSDGVSVSTGDGTVSLSPDNVIVDLDDGAVSLSPDGVSVSDGEDWEIVSPDELREELQKHDIDVFSPEDLAFISIATPIIILIGLVIAVVGLAVHVLLENPLEVGGRRFFVHNLHQQASVREVLYAFDQGWWQSVKTLFLRDIKIIGWSLLLVVPGIVKSYEYRMIPYLLAEDPTMPTEAAFAESRRLMDGNKWAAFVLDLSFVGWGLLTLVTAGIAGVFYVGPYRAQTDAALYDALRYGDGIPRFE